MKTITNLNGHTMYLFKIRFFARLKVKDIIRKKGYYPSILSDSPPYKYGKFPYHIIDIDVGEDRRRQWVKETAAKVQNPLGLPEIYPIYEVLPDGRTFNKVGVYVFNDTSAGGIRPK